MLFDITGAVLASENNERAITDLASAIREAAVRLDLACHIEIRDVRANRQVTITEVAHPVQELS